MPRATAESRKRPRENRQVWYTIRGERKPPSFLNISDWHSATVEQFAYAVADRYGTSPKSVLIRHTPEGTTLLAMSKLSSHEPFGLQENPFSVEVLYGKKDWNLAASSFYSVTFFFLSSFFFLLAIEPLPLPTLAASSTKPQSLLEKQFDSVLYGPCCNALVLQAHLLLYSPLPTLPDNPLVANFRSSLERAYYGLSTTAKGAPLMDVAGLRGLKNLKEEAITSLVAADLAECLKDYCHARADIESSLARRLRLTHQTTISPPPQTTVPDQRMDIVLFHDFYARECDWIHKASDVLFPFCLIEFTKSATKTIQEKLTQVSVYANVIFCRLMQFQKYFAWVPLIGVVMSESEMRFRLYAPTLSPADDGVSKHWTIAEMELYRCPVSDPRCLHLLVHVMVEWTIICKKFLCSPEGKRQVVNSVMGFPLQLHGSSNIIEWENKMYKSYDYRPISLKGVVEPCNQRDPAVYFEHGGLSAVETVVEKPYVLHDCNSGLKIIRYDKVQGSHVPTYVGHFVSLVEKVENLHAKGIVHGDLRFANVIFTCQGSSSSSSAAAAAASSNDEIISSTLIDFDYSGKVGVKSYPVGFNIDIGDDGKRHPEVNDNVLLKYQHDWFSLTWMFQQFRPSEAAACEAWDTLLALVQQEENAWADYMDVLVPFYNIALLDVRNINFSVLQGKDDTGSPKRTINPFY